MVRHHLFTSESVAEGHPDKVSDQISDAILDEVIGQDKRARVDAETLVMQGTVIVTGQVTTTAYVNVKQVVREVLRDIGFNNAKDGLDWETCGVLTSIEEQSPDIALGVDRPLEEIGAGDQGCLRKGTLVRTDHGFVSIESVRPGDKVLTYLGYKNVISSRKTGLRELVGVTLENGMHLESTSDHRILCYDRTGGVYWKQASELTTEDYICFAKPSGTFSKDNIRTHVDRSHFFTKYNHRVYGPEDLVLNEGIGYFLGDSVGDGNNTKPNQMSIAFANNAEHVPVVSEIAEREMPGRWRVYYSQTNGYVLQTASVVLRKHFELLGIGFERAPAKSTPLAIWESPRAVIVAYLRGLFDSDGTIVVETGRSGMNIRIRLGSSSLRLLRETQLLLNEFGIKSTIVFNTRTGTPTGKGGYESKHDSYVLSLSGFESYQRFLSTIGFSDPEKSRKARKYSSYYSAKPRNSRGIYLLPHPTKNELIDEGRLGLTLPFAISRFAERADTGSDEVFDIEVEDMNLFCANGIYVHNSVFGYASSETKELMPLPITLAHKIVKQLADVRHDGTLPYLRPDGKSQVTVEYGDGKPQRVDAVVVAAQHKEIAEETQVREDVIEKVIKSVVPKGLIDSGTKFIVNGTGRFVIGGTLADTGLTGRKIIVDTYGGVGSHGGGCYCIAGDALVNHLGGLSRLEDLQSKVDETLIVKTDTHPMLANEWFDNGVMSTIRVATEDGYSLEGSEHQLVRVIDVNGNYEWKRLDSLRKGDYIAIQRKHRLFGPRADASRFTYSWLPGTHRRNEFEPPKTLTEEYAYLMGLLIGDGYCMRRDVIQICVPDPEMKKVVQDLSLRLFGTRGTTLGHWWFMSGVKIRAYLEYLGLDKSRAWEKDVPQSIFGAPKKVVAAFLRGLFDTHGRIGRTGRKNSSADIWLGSSSRDLINSVQGLLLNFGIITAVARISDGYHVSELNGRKIISRHGEYRLRVKGADSIRIFQKEIGFGLPSKQKTSASLDCATKRDVQTIPNQRERIIRLWQKLPNDLRKRDEAKIGRFTRARRGKATKELTYSKLREFIDTYGEILPRDEDFAYLEYLLEMGHYYSRVDLTAPSINHVFDLSVPGSQTFTANGFVVHNSGKDPTKVDRSGSYMARYIAKNIVAAGLAEKCQVQIAYAIGVVEPVSFMVDTFGTGKAEDEKITAAAEQLFDMRPGIIIRDLDLLRPIYRKTACYGHFGREDPDFTWERTDRAELLRNKLA